MPKAVDIPLGCAYLTFKSNRVYCLERIRREKNPEKGGGRISVDSTKRKNKKSFRVRFFLWQDVEKVGLYFFPLRIEVRKELMVQYFFPNLFSKWLGGKRKKEIGGLIGEWFSFLG